MYTTRAASPAFLLFTLIFLHGCNGGNAAAPVTPPLVTPPIVTPPATNLTVISDADWIAFQDSPAGTWVRVSPDTAGGTLYTLPVTDATRRYGIAIHTTNNQGNNNAVEVVHATLDELSSIDSLNQPSSMVNVTGAVSNSTTGNTAFISMGLSSDVAAATFVSNQSYGLQVRPGTRDMIAAEYDAPGNLVKATILRDINVTADMSQNLDFASLPVTNITHNLTVIGETGANNSRAAYFTSKNGATLWLSIGSPATWRELSFTTIPGDMYSFFGSSCEVVQADTIPSGCRWMRLNTGEKSQGDVELNLTPINPFTGATVSLTGATGLNYAPRPNGPALRTYSIRYNQGAFTGTRIETTAFTYSISPGWLGAETSYNLPNLAAITGFDPAWSLRTGASASPSIILSPITVEVTAVMATVPIGKSQQYWVSGLETPGMKIEAATTKVNIGP